MSFPTGDFDGAGMEQSIGAAADGQMSRSCNDDSITIIWVFTCMGICPFPQAISRVLAYCLSQMPAAVGRIPEHP